MEDYGYYKNVAKEHRDVWPSDEALKIEISKNRFAFKQAGVILEAGSGEFRKKILFSWNRYIAHLRNNAA